MVSTEGIPAKNLGDTMYFRIYAKLSDGSYVYTKVLSYSARMYAKSMLSSTSSTEKEKNLVAQLMHYGAGSESVVFVYLGDGQLLRHEGTGTIVTITGDEYSSENILVTLIAYDRFAVIRPSMAA